VRGTRCAGHVRVKASQRTEESTRFFQERLARMYAVGFVLSGSFLLATVLVRGLMGDGVDELRQTTRWFHIAATICAGGLWWFI
jgi:hypothetical protein